VGPNVFKHAVLLYEALLAALLDRCNVSPNVFTSIQCSARYILGKMPVPVYHHQL